MTAPGPSHLAPSQRLAVFDNDGTLWCEKPAYAQMFFLQDDVEQHVKEHPALRDQPTIRTLLSGSLAAIRSVAITQMLSLAAEVFEGMTPEEYDDFRDRYMLRHSAALAALLAAPATTPRT